MGLSINVNLRRCQCSLYPVPRDDRGDLLALTLQREIEVWHGSMSSNIVGSCFSAGIVISVTMVLSHVHFSKVINYDVDNSGARDTLFL